MRECEGEWFLLVVVIGLARRGQLVSHMCPPGSLLSPHPQSGPGVFM